MRGQATPIQSVPSETTRRLSTTDRSWNKLPSYLQSLHNLQPARPSKVSSGLGSDVRSDLSVKPNTWKLPDLSSLHNVGRTRKSAEADRKTRFSSEDMPLPNSPYPTQQVQSTTPVVWRPVRSAAMQSIATASGQNNGGA